jgi:photosystem II stability/assembly factor-like uncharacterized protein
MLRSTKPEAGHLMSRISWTRLSSRARVVGTCAILIGCGGTLALVVGRSGTPAASEGVASAAGSTASGVDGPSTPPTAPDLSTPGGASKGIGAFNAVTCANTSFCVGVGATASGAGAVATSINGGSTWTPQSLPTLTPELDAVSCADSSDCVVVGPDSALKTTNGGSTWTAASLPANDQTLLGVSCTAQGTCVAVGVVPNFDGPFLGAIDVSANGGATWGAAALPNADASGLNDVACMTNTECIAVGDEILTSDDDGQTWVQQTVPGGMDQVRSIACPVPQDCLAIGPNPRGISSPDSGADAVVTADGGTTWANEVMPAGTWSLQQVTCAGTSTCFAGGVAIAGTSAGVFLGSTNSGTTWTSTTPPGGLTAISAMACPAATDCVAAGQSAGGPATATTTDGTTWTVRPLSATSLSPVGAPS